MKRLFGFGSKSGTRAPSDGARTAAERADELIRAGFDRECEADPEGADRAYQDALDAAPGHCEAQFFLGRIAAWDKRFDEAIALFLSALETNPGEVTYLFELGNAWRGLQRHEEARAAFRACLEQLPENTPVRINLAVALIELDRREEARLDLERLRDWMPDITEAHFNLAGIYREYARIADSIAAYRTILRQKPGDAATFSNLLLLLHYSTEYTAAQVAEEHRRFGEAFARRTVAPRPDPAWPRRLRIGYVSPDFRSHVVMFFFEPILARHDRGRFEVTCYCTNSQRDSVTERLRGLAEHWVDCEYLTAEELAERIRADRIDILVDLAGHTAFNSLLTFALKPAPVQASYLGYPDTTGLPAIDYRVSDAFADPAPEADALSTERIVRLPHSYFCYRPPATTPEPGELPAETTGVITFGCFNNFHKMSGAFLDAVAAVLRAVPGARFMLKGRPLSIPDVAEGVRRRFMQAGIEASRLELRGWEKATTDHLAVYRSVDIALDSFPYNGATTTCEALWMGVPVVTLAGDRHAARAGVSLLNAVGLGELVAQDVEEYVSICARLAGDRERLAELRRTLRSRLLASPLMDEEGFTRSLEQAYFGMWDRFRLQADQARGALPAGDDALLARAREARSAGRLDEAEAACLQLLERAPGHLAAITLLWDLAFEAGRPGMALAPLQRAIATGNDHPQLHYMLGCVLQEQGKIQDALNSFERATALDPAMARAHNNLGCLFEAAGVLDEAVERYRRALGADPGLANASYNLGNVLRRQGRAAAAIDHIARAIALEPGHADWSCNLGELYLEQGLPGQAIVRLREALSLDTASHQAYAALGTALLSSGCPAEASEAYASAVRLKPRDAASASRVLWLEHVLSDTSDLTSAAAAHEWVRWHGHEVLRCTAHPRRAVPAGARLRVGYLLPDPRWTDVAPFLIDLLCGHAAGGIEATVYANFPGEDAESQELRRAAARWCDVSAMSDRDAALRIRADAIHVLVDLAGHAPGGRPLALAHGPAPVQATWLGYPGPVATDATAYRITDAVVDPPERPPAPHGEDLCRLPGPLLCYRPPADGPEPVAPPLLDEKAVTFGCLGDLSRLTGEMTQAWADILRALPSARLVLRAAGKAGELTDLVQRGFTGHGVAPGRVTVLGGEDSPSERLARYNAIDIALDTFPCNGVRSTCEALWMGVPVITRVGTSRQARVGASLLGEVGLLDLAAADAGAYTAAALALASDASRLQALRSSLRGRMRASRLMDTAGFVRGMEALYRELLARAASRRAAA